MPAEFEMLPPCLHKRRTGAAKISQDQGSLQVSRRARPWKRSQPVLMPTKEPTAPPVLPISHSPLTLLSYRLFPPSCCRLSSPTPCGRSLGTDPVIISHRLICPVQTAPRTGNPQPIVNAKVRRCPLMSSPFPWHPAPRRTPATRFRPPTAPVQQRH